MKNLLISVIVIIYTVCSTQLNAQLNNSENEFTPKKNRFVAHLGYGEELIFPTFKYVDADLTHLLRLNERFTLDSKVSFVAEVSDFNEIGTGLAGLTGIRLYLIDESYKARVFSNFQVGVGVSHNNTSEYADQKSNPNSFDIYRRMAAGVGIEIGEKLHLIASLELGASFFRMGYNF